MDSLLSWLHCCPTRLHRSRITAAAPSIRSFPAPRQRHWGLHTEEGTFRMPTQDISPITATFSRDSTHAHVLVVDGYGVSIGVTRGHLLIRDGIGRHRRERQLPRAQRTVRRIIILGHTGHITLDAVRWCADTGVTLLQLDTDGPVLLTAAPQGPMTPGYVGRKQPPPAATSASTWPATYSCRRSTGRCPLPQPPSTVRTWRTDSRSWRGSCRPPTSSRHVRSRRRPETTTSPPGPACSAASPHGTPTGAPGVAPVHRAP